MRWLPGFLPSASRYRDEGLLEQLGCRLYRRANASQADFRFREHRHVLTVSAFATSNLAFVQKRIQMVMGRVHIRSLDSLGDFRREVGDPVDPALEGSKPLQLLVLARGHEISTHPAQLGRRLLGRSQGRETSPRRYTAVPRSAARLYRPIHRPSIVTAKKPAAHRWQFPSLVERLSPALEHVDSSSGALGSAVNRALETLVPIISAADVPVPARQKWLERLYEAHAADQMPYIESLADYWGELCVIPDLASAWADQMIGITRMALSPDESLRGH